MKRAQLRQNCLFGGGIYIYFILMNTEHISTLLAQHIPEVVNQKIELVRASGLTNRVFVVKVNGDPQWIFKELSEGIQQSFPRKICDLLSKKGLIPLIVASNKQYKIERFIANGRHPDQPEIVQGRILKTILTKLYGMHQIEVPFIPTEHKLMASSVFSDEEYEKILKYKQKCPQNSNYKLLFNKIKAVLQERIKWGKHILPAVGKNIAVCHNDLNNLNIICTSEDIFLIDYDYVAFNFIGYDIANLINETSFDYSPTSYPGFKILRTYSSQELTEISQHYPGYYPELKDEVLRFMSVCNLYWAIWSLQRFQLNVSDIFGMLEHGLKRMELFELYMQKIEKSG